MTALRTHGSSISMKFIPMTAPSHDYMVAMATTAIPSLAELAKETAGLGPISLDADRAGSTLIDPDQRHRRASAVEIGTVHRATARSAWPALSRPKGTLLCRDISESGLDCAPLLGGSRRRRPHRAPPGAGRSRHSPPCPPIDVDFAFIDADKASYRAPRGAPAAHADERTDRLRQRPVDGSGASTPSPESDDDAALQQLNRPHRRRQARTRRS